ncbi:hypothetical protein [Amycolatopsis sp. NPDC049868]|uniref:hypothetical protein n=1 Tax=Amycolatopsis sp. NPDC049868 TaxID=3363934 RepID=UPI00378FBF2D
MNRMVAALLVSAGAVAALGGCGTTTAGTPVTVVREIVSPPNTRAPSLTSCQRLFAEGFSYTYAYNAWVNAGRPLSWDADRDGYPCEQSYGNRN